MLGLPLLSHVVSLCCGNIESLLENGSCNLPRCSVVNIVVTDNVAVDSLVARPDLKGFAHAAASPKVPATPAPR